MPLDPETAQAVFDQRQRRVDIAALPFDERAQHETVMILQRRHRHAQLHRTLRSALRYPACVRLEYLKELLFLRDLLAFQQSASHLIHQLFSHRHHAFLRVQRRLLNRRQSLQSQLRMRRLLSFRHHSCAGQIRSNFLPITPTLNRRTVWNEAIMPFKTCFDWRRPATFRAAQS